MAIHPLRLLVQIPEHRNGNICRNIILTNLMNSYIYKLIELAKVMDWLIPAGFSLFQTQQQNKSASRLSVLWSVHIRRHWH